MAFMDYLPNNHKRIDSRGLAFSPAGSTFHPDLQHTIPPSLQPPVPSQGAPVNLTHSPHLPPPPLYSSYVCCPHCHYQQQALNSYSVSSVCSNCNHSFVLPPPPPIGHSLIQHSHSAIPQPPQEVAIRPPRNSQPGSTISLESGSKLAAISKGQRSHESSLQHTIPEGTSSSSMTDRFMMTSIVDVVETLFRDPADNHTNLTSSTDTSIFSTSLSSHSSSMTGYSTSLSAYATSMAGYSTSLSGYSTSLSKIMSTSEDTFTSLNEPAVPPLSSIALGSTQTPEFTHQTSFPSSSSSVKLVCQCGSDKVAMCMECQEYLCSSCITEHKQTCKESEILIYPPSDSSPLSSQTSPPICAASLQSPVTEIELALNAEQKDDGDTCRSHPDEKMSHFCFICAKLVCSVCAGSSEHVHHKCVDVQEAYSHIQPRVDDVMRKAQVELDLLEYSLADVTSMNCSVNERQEEAISKVKQIFQAHREALASREEEVIAQIGDIASKRMSSLKSKQERIVNALDLLKALLRQEEKAIQDGKKPHVVMSHHKLSSELNRCHYYTSSLLSPVEDDSFILKSNVPAAQSALKSLCTFTTAPYPLHCTAMGVGLVHPRMNRLCTVILVTKDRAGEPCVDGGERLFLQLKPIGQNSNGSVGLSVNSRDNFDGTYSITFRPRAKGEHQLVIAIRGQHIKGSPFTIFVDGGREYGRFGNVMHVFGSEGSGDGQFSRPWGICCDQHGNIIIGDRSNHRIQVFEINGTFKHKFGSEGIRAGQFNRPAGVAVTREGHIVVADKDNHRIQVLKIDGTFLFMFGSKGGNDGQMIYPYDVAVNQSDGRIAVTDTGNHRLLIFSHDGILLGKFGYKGYLCGHFDSPRGIAFNDEGHIIVSDFNVHHILVIHPDGTTARILGSQGGGNGQFMRPQGIAVDSMGNFIVADTRNNRIVIMHSSGQLIAKFGTPGNGPGQFDRPTSIAVLPDGHLAVVDFGNSRVQIF